MLKKILWCECSKKWADLAPLALRIITGIIFMAHGYMKLQNVAGTTEFFGSLGIPDAGFFAILVACIEFFGGAALIVGFVTHWAAKLNAIDMVVALLLVHMKNGLTGQGGMEFVLLLLASLVAIASFGPGKWSVDKWLEKEGWKPVS